MTKKKIDSDNILQETRTIHLFEDIDADVVDRIVREFNALKHQNKKPIHIVINSFGGEVYSSLAIYDFLRSHEDIEVKTYILGAAMSGGSIVFLAGDERYMYPNSGIMVHSNQLEGTFRGGVGDLRVTKEESEKLFSILCQVYGERTNMDSAYWEKKIEHRELYIWEEEALELGFITGPLTKED